MAGGVGILGGYGLRYKVTATRIADWEEYVHRLANQSLQMDSSGNVDITGVLNIGTSGGIYQGTGTFASPTTGLKIYNSGGIGLIAGYNAGTVQWYADTDGKLYAGAGNVILDAGGIGIVVPTATADLQAYKFMSGATTVSALQAYYDAGVPLINVIELVAKPISGLQSQALLTASSPVNRTALAQLTSIYNGASKHFYLKQDSAGSYLDSNAASVTFSGGLNVGSASGATAGQIKASASISGTDGTFTSGLNVGSATGAGTGAIKASSTITATSGFLAPLSNGTAVWGIDAQATGTTVADTATYQPFGNTNAFSGLFLVNALDSGSVGLFMQGGNTVVLISESVANTFSITQGTGSRVNVYLSTNVVTIENRRGLSIEIRTFAIRTRNFY